MKKLVLGALFVACLLFPVTAFATEHGPGPNSNQTVDPAIIEDQK